jgi:hypothetical protein
LREPLLNFSQKKVSRKARKGKIRKERKEQHKEKKKRPLVGRPFMQTSSQH